MLLELHVSDVLTTEENRSHYHGKPWKWEVPARDPSIPPRTAPNQPFMLCPVVTRALLWR